MTDEAELRMLGAGLTAGPGETDRREELAMIRGAMRDRRKLEITYRSEDGACGPRVVWPVALGFFDKVEMLAAWCELRDAFRHFRVDRVEALSALEEDVPRSRDSLLAAYRRIEPHARV